MERYFIFTVLLLFSSSAISDQSTIHKTNNNWWFNVGFIGSTNGEDFNGRGFIVEATMDADSALYTFRKSHYDNRTRLVKAHLDCGSIFDECDNNPLTTSFKEYALMYGIHFKNKSYVTSTGLAYLEKYNHINNTKEYSLIGLPIDFHYKLATSNHMGIWLTIFANLNRKESFLGTYFCFSFGSF